jgi:hypothetical protein
MASIRDDYPNLELLIRATSGGENFAAFFWRELVSSKYSRLKRAIGDRHVRSVGSHLCRWLIDLDHVYRHQNATPLGTQSTLKLDSEWLVEGITGALKLPDFQELFELCDRELRFHPNVPKDRVQEVCEFVATSYKAEP